MLSVNLVGKVRRASLIDVRLGCCFLLQEQRWLLKRTPKEADHYSSKTLQY